MDWTNPLEPEPPPSSGPSPLLNSDTTELTLVECVRTPLAGPYGTAHGLNSVPSSSFCTPPDAVIRDSNVHKRASRSLTVQPLSPRPCDVLTDANTTPPSFEDLSPGMSVSERAHKPFTNGTTSPLSSWVDTSRRVATPLKKCVKPVGLKPVCLSSRLLRGPFTTS
ncbi:hypothetical protein BS47DRAFT_7517 [Hydnum rufescens UP504]|uniref:Uncharacterized protein n=1 Tax=Hydnum rufescens UP504 TaxID=1448309 RepID=A0A9P6DZZ2_9AGAM|nr:hypothetical protein BS47DRAFT_7517 [Hydnum rufescens UP504]